MPQCLDCGNEHSFGSTLIPPVAPTANGPISGILAEFDDNGYITEMTSVNGDIDIAQEAWENPKNYFNICYLCGGNNIAWK